ncbi:hypothetical protein GH714_033337 [Hevea brasiliensis]|uniref:Growth-regulating factor n=1 Tax=Hevea brasiliensis TaxID=3981 RepID=A0A6A6L3T3_HEVBR|nr:hypothetical protein GH714_033337 [Hevea brasiliensis]
MDFGFPSLDGFVAYGSNQAASQVSPIEANNQKVQHFSGMGHSLPHGLHGQPLDFEPGRCRGTDGKKWQCSRDVVGDQKYYERHMNRGRYHAGKPADGQTVTAAVQTYNSNVVPATISISTPLITSKEPVNIHTATVEELRILQRGGYVNSRDCDEPFLSFSERETQDQHLLRHLIEDWPKDQCSCSAISWPEELKSDWTQLSMSTPMQEKIALLPLKLSREFDPTQMSVGASADFSELNQTKQANGYLSLEELQWVIL